MPVLARDLRARRDHRWAPARMSPYLDGGLRARARARLERHVAQCAECRRVLESLRRMVRRLSEVDFPAAGEAPGLVADIRARLREVEAQ